MKIKNILEYVHFEVDYEGLLNYLFKDLPCEDCVQKLIASSSSFPIPNKRVRIFSIVTFFTAIK